MPGRPTIWIIVGQGPITLAVGAVGVWTFLLSILSLLFLPLWETARYRLKYCLKGPLNLTQQQQQPNIFSEFIHQVAMKFRFRKGLAEKDRTYALFTLRSLQTYEEIT